MAPEMDVHISTQGPFNPARKPIDEIWLGYLWRPVRAPKFGIPDLLRLGRVQSPGECGMLRPLFPGRSPGPSPRRPSFAVARLSLGA